MINRFFIIGLLLVFLIILSGNTGAITRAEKNQPALVYVDLRNSADLNRFAATQLPFYASLEHGLLTGADVEGQQALVNAGLSIQVLDPSLSSNTYYLAESHNRHPALDFTSFGQVLLNTSSGALLRMDSGQVDALARAGAELKAINLTPKPLPAAKKEIFPSVVEPDPIVQMMVDQISETQVYTYERQLTGELLVWVDNAWYTITTRYTNSGEPIQKATHFVGQHMQDLGMNVDYHVWNNDTNPDVVGEIPGQVNPDDVYIIGAHLDAVDTTPGADDNASGSVATLIAADILSQYQWSCSLRFAFWTGEEQGLLGSEAYAQEAYAAGENILGYLNLDMIAWNSHNSYPSIDIEYNPDLPSTLDLAHLYEEIITTYDIHLFPELAPVSSSGSDNSSFWDYGYTAILAIEDMNDFNPYYHLSQDTPAHTDLTYFTENVKAAVAGLAHMSGCLIPGGVGQLEGHVTTVNNEMPIEGAAVTTSDILGHDFPITTDVNGYYLRSLTAGTYTVTAAAYSYLPVSINGVILTTDTITTQDFSLLPLPTHVITGTITEDNTGLPLLAEISFIGSPTAVWSNPATGFYQTELPEGSYTMHVRADLHRPKMQTVILDSNRIEDFILEPLPCVLLVDDDQDDPDVNFYYTDALKGLGVDYDLWDTDNNFDPTITDILGYRKLLWYNGGPWYGTFSPPNETAVAQYLDVGGDFFLSSQSYLDVWGLSSFAKEYLHVWYYYLLQRITVMRGLNDFSGLGPYSLIYPFDNYTQDVVPQYPGEIAFLGDRGVAAIYFAGDNYTTMFSLPFEAIPVLSDRQAVMQRVLDLFGSCQPMQGVLEGRIIDSSTAMPLPGVMISASEHITLSDPDGFYTITLPSGYYKITASLEGYVSQSNRVAIVTERDVYLDFALRPIGSIVNEFLPIVNRK